MKNRIIQAIDDNREAIIACGEYVLCNPEMGFKEFKTSEYIKNEFKRLNIPFKENLAVTGVMGVVGDPEADINICIIGEMDAIKCFDHPFADKLTGASHACGHNAQLAQLIGAAYGIVESGALEQCSCKITFLAVPAEEFVELDYRKTLVDSGRITYMSGKQELIHEGVFDDIDIAIMLHAHAMTPEPRLYMMGSSLGFESKRIVFRGKSAHGSEPWNGLNALDAAVMAIAGINANRAAFKESDRVRIHPIISNGGDLVNVIPSEAVIETYVRAASTAALQEACLKVDNAAKAGALALGVECEIVNTKGYAPLHQDKNLSEAFESNAGLILGTDKIEHNIDMTGSSDIGDVSGILPTIQPTLGGFDGALHSKDFKITDEEFVYITASKILALTVWDLAKDNAQKAKRIKSEYRSKAK